MNRKLFRILFAVLPLISGMYSSTFRLWDNARFVNLLWGCIYGTGFWVFGYLPGGLRSRLTLVVGGLVWPLCVSAFMFWVSGKLWNRNDAKITRLSVAVLVLSLFVVVPLASARRPPFSRFPLFTLFSDAAY
jgi:hypothetical protein